MITHQDSHIQRLHEALLLSDVQRAHVIARLQSILDRERAPENGDIVERLESFLVESKHRSMTAGLPALRRRLRGLS